MIAGFKTTCITLKTKIHDLYILETTPNFYDCAFIQQQFTWKCD